MVSANLLTDPPIPNSLELLRIKYGDASEEPDSATGTNHGTNEDDPEEEDGRSSSGTVSHNASILIDAAEKGDIGTVEVLLGNVNLNPDIKTKYQSRSALHLACGYGQYEVTERLLQVCKDER